MLNSEKMKKTFTVGLVFSSASIVFLATALFCQFYSRTIGSGEYMVTVFPFSEYVMYAIFAMVISLGVGIVGLVAGREDKTEIEMLTTTALPEELRGEKRKVNKLRAAGYALYGIGLAIFIIGLIFSYLQATDFLSTLVLQGNGQMIFLNSIVPWIVAAVVLWAIATLPVTLSYRNGAGDY